MTPECNAVCGEPGSQKALSESSSPSAFLLYDIFLAFTGQICAIPVHYRREEKHVSLPKNQCSPQSPSVAVRAGDKRPLRRPVLGPPQHLSCPLVPTGPQHTHVHGARHREQRQLLGALRTGASDSPSPWLLSQLELPRQAGPIRNI